MSQKYSEDTGYVNIHGQDVKVLVCDKTGRILIPIDEVREMGFRIYRKNQYSRLLIDDKQFDREFDLFMLQAAQTYMLEKKIAFNEHTVIDSIQKCKKILTEETSPNKFTRDHVIRHDSGDNITVTANLRSPTLSTMQVHNDQQNFSYKKRSPASSVHSFDGRHNSPDYKRNNNFTHNQERSSSYDKKDQNLNSSFELRKPKTVINADGSPQFINGQDDKKRRLNMQNQVKLSHVGLNNPEHTILVTHVETSAPFFWAQDTENSETLLEIDAKVKEEAEKNKQICDFLLNKVYLAQHEGLWARCKVIKFKPLKVFFIDYGNIGEVTEIKEASEELAKYPCQCVKLKLEDSSMKPNDFETLRVKVLNKHENGTYTVVIAETDDAFFSKPQPLCQLQHGQRVMIISQRDGKLALRTKECYDKLKQVEQALAEVTSKPLSSVKKDQLVLFSRNSNLQRAVVTNFQENKVELELLDYYDKVKVDLSSISNITESLAKEPISYLVTPSVKGLSDKTAEIVQNLIETRAKSTVVLNGDEFDLQLGKDLLSDKLKPPPGESHQKRTMLKDMTRFKPKLGVGEYILNTFRNKDKLTIGCNDAIESHLDHIIKTELDDNQPYEPITGEICFGSYLDSWSRCVVNRTMNSRYEVEFIDFGNVEILKGDQLRKLSDDVKNTPILGIPCRLIGLPHLSNVDELLKQIVVEGDSYEINIKQLSGDHYEVEVPALIKNLRESV
ncbi:uncharacterized protein LOC664513 [Tribolium castaneum]|uniref:Tudor domain-containing protein n=1 Tax=Tribolium castaneum TaxID=7070 RepID=A0A139WEK7_TRICA|nr:PREDICTED: uncharacterized protein LOC664513 [Tribolium castaneum]KYB26364.1 hypothetical protein TcasGA2_TC033807 [Tribolium castaneum]|eukprot:XP_976490.1 PREDICTED: uncharacterized protein LOC664513 [Tribolium castaneum]